MGFSRRPPAPALRGRTQQRRLPRWQAFESGLGKQVRTRWRRDPASPQPSLDALDTAEAAGDRGGPLRLVESRPAGMASARDRRFVLLALQVLLVVVVVGQRITVPIGSLPISLPLVASYVGLLVIRLRGGIRYNRVRTELYLAGGAAVVAATWVGSLVGNEFSLNSLLLLLVLYLPWVFCVAAPFADLLVPVLRTFVRLMVLTAVIGGLQMLAQLLLGWRYEDYLASWLPPEFLVVNFNTANPIAYDNPIVKANAFYFLEPSFLCQFCALALIISLLLRAPAWQPLLLGLGMAATLSGTGILLLVGGVIVLFLRVPSRIKPSYLIAGILGLIIIFQTPAAGILLDRRSEASQQNSSGSLRFVQPYTEVAAGLAEDPDRYLVGAGAGSSERLLESTRGGGQGVAVVYSIAPKLGFEYGLIAAVIFVLFLLVSILRGPPLPALPSSIIVMIFFLSGSLLQPHTILTAWLLTSIWGAAVTVGVSDRLAAARRGALTRGAQAQA